MSDTIEVWTVEWSEGPSDQDHGLDSVWSTQDGAQARAKAQASPGRTFYITGWTLDHPEQRRAGTPYAYYSNPLSL